MNIGDLLSSKTVLYKKIRIKSLVLKQDAKQTDRPELNKHAFNLKDEKKRLLMESWNESDMRRHLQSVTCIA